MSRRPAALAADIAIVLVAIGWIVGGFLEKLLFRGFLLNRIAALLGAWNTVQIWGVYQA